MQKYWHYADKPFSPSVLPNHPANVPNAETPAQILLAALSGTAPDDVKSYDIAWIEPLTGDVHQPLQAIARFTAVHTNGDSGGNDVKFRAAPCRDNLHSYRDGLPGTTIDPADIHRIGNQLLHKPKPAGGVDGKVPGAVG